MDFLKGYLTNDEPAITKKIVNNYKIVTINDKNQDKPFLIYEQDQILNSKTLMKLLLIKTLPDDMLNRLINNNSTAVKRYTNRVSDISGILYEDSIFFDF